MSKDNGGPAFPVLDYLTPDRVATCTAGMTLRDYFAVKAMQGIIASEGLRFMGWHSSSCDDTGKISGAAYLFADAMLKERSK